MSDYDRLPTDWSTIRYLDGTIDARPPRWAEDEWSEAANSTADHVRVERPTRRRAVAPAIRAYLNRNGPSDSRTVKAAITELLDVSTDTIERAVHDMADIARKRGYRGKTVWTLNNRNGAHGLESDLHDQIDAVIYGQRQNPTATERDIAAELDADEWVELMGATKPTQTRRQQK